MADYEGETLMGALADSDDSFLKIFETEPIQVLLNYKWHAFSKRMHMTGAFIHAVYVLSLSYYVKITFLDKRPYDPDDP